MIPIGPYQPDVAETIPGIARSVINALPVKGAGTIDYKPQKQLAAVSTATALAAAPRGTVSVIKKNASYAAFAGTASNLYELQGDYTWSSIGSGYTVPTDYDWSFVQFGDYLIATNSADGMLEYDVENGGAVSSVTNAPAAEFVFTANNMLFALAAAGNVMELRNSDFFDRNTWSGSGDNTGAAGTQVFTDGGRLQAGVDLQNNAALIFQDTAIKRLNFTSSGALPYTISTVKRGIGSVGPKSVVQHGNSVFFLHSDGFYATDGQTIRSIGAEKVNRTFFDNINTNDLDKVQGAADPINTIIWWRYKANDVSDDVIFSDMIGYDWQLDTWVTSDQTTSALFSMATPALTMDNIDTYGTMETLPYPLDARFWKGGAPNMAALDENYKVGFFDGDNAAATFDTSVVENGASQKITSCRPLTDASSATVKLGTKRLPSDSMSFGAAVSKEGSGRCPLYGRGLYSQFRLEIPAAANWNYARGIDNIIARGGGSR